jgi:thymidylate synthase (FAD)
MKVDYIQHCGSDLSVVNAARVSFDKESDFVSDNQLANKDKKLVQYLSDHEHTSPFNHAFLTVRVKAPIFVARQLVKHKFMPWNEISRRYVDSEPEFYEPEVWRYKADNVKQGSRSSGLTQQEVTTKFFDTVEPTGYVDVPEEINTEAFKTYNELLKIGVCAELARVVLPQSTYTEWYWSGTLGAWLDMLKLRLKPDTQQETRKIAEMIAEIVKEHWPVSYDAILKEIA